MGNARQRALCQIVGLTIVFLLPMLLTYWGARAAGILGLTALTRDDAGLLLVGAVADWVTLALLLTVMWQGNITPQEIGLRHLEVRHFVSGFLFFILGAGLSHLVAALAQRVLPGARLLGMDYRLGSAGTWAAVIFAALLTRPLCQEIFYRGFAIATLRDRLGNYWIAGAVACFVFAFSHLPYVGVAGAVAMGVWGVLPTLLFIWMRSLYPAIIMHLLHGVWAFVLLKLILGQGLPLVPS